MSRFVAPVLAVLSLALVPSAVCAEEAIRYRYVSLDDVSLPAQWAFFLPAQVVEGGRVVGTVLDATSTDVRVAWYRDGKLTVQPQQGWVTVANAGGTSAGYVMADPVNGVAQAAIFEGDRTTLVPQLPGETFSFAVALNDSGTALVQSFGTLWDVPFVRFELVRHGKVTPLDLGPEAPADSVFHVAMNDAGLIAGSATLGAFRFDPRTGRTTLLHPFPGDPTETQAWGLGINNRGDVVGYSFTAFYAPPYHERIGVWDLQGRFRTAVVETGCSNALLVNDPGEIVITNACSGQPPTSYLVPRPGERLDLATLVRNLPPGQDLYSIMSIDNQGDLLGASMAGNAFLLERMHDGEHEPAAVRIGAPRQRHANRANGHGALRRLEK